MSIEQRVSKLEMEMMNLQQAFLNMQKRQVNTVGRVDDTSNKVVEITPYTDSNIAYIGDTSLLFDDVPQGNVSVFTDKPIGAYSVERVTDKIYVNFDEPLEEVTTVSISIQ